MTMLGTPVETDGLDDARRRLGELLNLMADFNETSEDLKEADHQLHAAQAALESPDGHYEDALQEAIEAADIAIDCMSDWAEMLAAEVKAGRVVASTETVEWVVDKTKEVLNAIAQWADTARAQYQALR